MRLAEQLGGEAVTLPGHNPPEEIVRYAEANNVTHIVIGKSKKSRISELIHGSVTHELLRRAGEISVHVVAPREQDAIAPKKTATAPEERTFDVLPYVWSTGLVADRARLAVWFCSTSSTCATSLWCFCGRPGERRQLWAESCPLCLGRRMLTFNFFFLPPLYTFTIADPENVVALFFFLIVAVIASNLTARVRSQAVVATQRAKTTEDLYFSAGSWPVSAALDDVLWATAFQVASMLKVQVVILHRRGVIADRANGIPARRHSR